MLVISTTSKKPTQQQTNPKNLTFGIQTNHLHLQALIGETRMALSDRALFLVSMAGIQAYNRSIGPTLKRGE